MTNLTPRDEAIMGAAMTRVHHPDSAPSLAHFIASVAAASTLMKSLQPDEVTSEIIDALAQHLEKNLAVILGGPAARVVLRIAQDGIERVKPCS